jgi:U3 small nucleolar RNA-associated protein 6
MNPESIDIWREYVRMELGFIENLRRRWDILGIPDTKGKVDRGTSDTGAVVDPSNIIFSGGEPEDNDLETNGINEIEMVAESDGLNRDEGAAAQRRIINGAIVKTVMTNAVECTCFTKILCERVTSTI